MKDLPLRLIVFGAALVFSAVFVTGFKGTDFEKSALLLLALATFTLISWFVIDGWKE